MSRLTLLTLPPSPHNIKIRLALAAKSLECDFVPVGFDDRSEVLAKSGQPLTPVLLDGERVVCDSFGIIRYLDANFSGPKLFPATREGMGEVEAWENFVRNGLAPIVGKFLGMAMRGTIDSAEADVWSRVFNQLLERVESSLEDRDFLMGDAPNAADLTVAPFVHYAALDPDAQEEGSFFGIFADALQVSPRNPRTRAWVERVFALEKAAASS